MWYNEEQQLTAMYEVALPDGFILNESNKNESRDGWVWSDIEPEWWKELNKIENSFEEVL